MLIMLELYISTEFQNEEPFKYDNPRLPFDEGDTDADSCVAYKSVLCEFWMLQFSLIAI